MVPGHSITLTLKHHEEQTALCAWVFHAFVIFFLQNIYTDNLKALVMNLVSLSLRR